MTPTKQENALQIAFNSKLFADAWRAWIRDRADSTQQGYNVTIKCLLEWLQSESITAPTREDIIKYRDYLLSPHASRKNGQEITFTADTAARYFRGCKMFFEFLEEQGLYKNITKHIRTPKASQQGFKRDALEKEDIIKVLDSIDRSNEEGKRAYFLVLACVSCGFRIIELQRANIEDIETIAGQHRLYIQGKGHLAKDDYQKLEGETWEALQDYLKSRQNKDGKSPLIASISSNAREGGGRLSEPSLSRIVKQILVKAGYNSRRITAHSLRHTAVTLAGKAGADLQERSKLARHSNIAITQRYDHILEKQTLRTEKKILDYIFSDPHEENEKTQQTKESLLTSLLQAYNSLNDAEKEALKEAIA